MKVENQMHPRPEQIERFLESEGPVCMVNLVKFRDRAAYPDGRDAERSGREVYMRYSGAMIELVESAGGRLVFEGDVHGGLIGTFEEEWDRVGIVEYPSAKALIEISSSEAFAEIEVHRTAGLEGQLNITTHATNEGR